MQIESFHLRVNSIFQKQDLVKNGENKQKSYEIISHCTGYGIC